MDESIPARMFEPFVTTTVAGKGTGRGLATAYGIVTRSGGHLQVDGTPGVGSTSTGTLPVADGVPAPGTLS